MRILLLEDEAPAARRLQRLLADVVPEVVVAATVATVSEAKTWLEANGEPDLYLADIELADGRCFDLFRIWPPKAPVIFTTAYDAFALQAFDHNGIAYLLKPIDGEQLRKAFDKLKVLQNGGKEAEHAQQAAIEKLLAQLAPAPKPGYRERFLLRVGEKFVPLEVKDIAYFLASEKLVLAVTHENRRHPLDETLDELEAALNTQQFFRLGRGVISARGAIQQIASHFNGRLKLTLRPDPQQEVFVSRERAPAFRDWMNW